ncbi:MAG: hypothetical protein Q8P02_05335, partial [Candidatus Micrarchaeota archaeon]|nr:hypothetical protein [Candidatus Micrarchaeota archaeon]
TAGYNGLEAGIGAVASFFLMVIAWQAHATAALVVLAALFGACLAFLFFNWHPAKVFPADIGTLVIGGALAVAVILGNMEKYGVILLIPAFYELFATAYYTAKKVERRSQCHNPRIRADLTLRPPPGAEKYSLAYRILSIRPMTEAALTATMLGLFAFSGILSWLVFAAGI